MGTACCLSSQSLLTLASVPSSQPVPVHDFAACLSIMASETPPSQALSEEPDYEDSLLHSAVKLLNSHHDYQAADTLSAVLASIANTPGRQAKKQRTAAPVEGADGAAAGAAAAAAAGVASGAALDAQVMGWWCGFQGGPWTGNDWVLG